MLESTRVKRTFRDRIGLLPCGRYAGVLDQ